MRLILLAAFFVSAMTNPAGSDEVSAKQVLASIESAKRALLKVQLQDGSWKTGGGWGEDFPVGVSSLALTALLSTGMTSNDVEIQRGLTWLRKQQPTSTYEISLMIQALAAAGEGSRDVLKVTGLVKQLEGNQIRHGPDAGSWSYNKTMREMKGAGDRSNSQFAVLALSEAQQMGVPVSSEIWKRARAHWLASQNGDGGWSYSRGGPASERTGSMTVAGIASLLITQAMLHDESQELNPDGTPDCCGEPALDKPLEAACTWMGDHFDVKSNPDDGRWLLYYLCGLERAARFSGRRYFVSQRGEKYDWYREGAEYLVSAQDQFSRTWHDRERDHPVVNASFGLMFLSKGLAPVLINKLKFGPRDANRAAAAGIDWNRHTGDVRNLTRYISSRPKWPKLLTWQTVDVSQANIAELTQAPILFISGAEAPEFAPQEVALLKEYVLEGGFIFVNNCCNGAAFDEGFRGLLRQMYAPSEATLKRLAADHPVFRSEFNLLDEKTGEPKAELWGVDAGQRTSIIYSPVDMSCLWNKWTAFEISGRPKELTAMIEKAIRVGTNVVAYVTERKLLNKLDRQK